jgi:hypothetical protein
MRESREAVNMVRENERKDRFESINVITMQHSGYMIIYEHKTSLSLARQTRRRKWPARFLIKAGRL